jgi:isocitrate lyase
MHLKRKLPVWLHADMEHLQNRMFNYVFHGRVSSVDRHDIQTQWNKIKHDMEVGLEYMDDAVAICSSKNVSLKANDKVSKSSPKAC